MDAEYALKTYYAEYLKNVRGVTASSAAHYLQALRTISKFMVEKGDVQNSIYEIQDLQKLTEVKDKLFRDGDFEALNKRGHSMYSAGFNHYYRFASGTGIADLSAGIQVMDTPMPTTKKTKTVTSGWGRSQIIKQQVIESTRYTCEIDVCHKTFIAKSTGHSYMEGHHMLAMKYQDVFSNSLDVYANVVSLCPVCHRLLHYGITSEKINPVRQLYHHRADRLAASGLKLSENEFERMCL